MLTGKNIENEIYESIMSCLRESDSDLSINAIARETDINRNTVSKYIEILNVQGRVNVNDMGSAKAISACKSVSSSKVIDKLSISVLLLDNSLNVIDCSLVDSACFLNDKFNLDRECKGCLRGQDVRDTEIPLFQSNEVIDCIKDINRKSLISDEIEDIGIFDQFEVDYNGNSLFYDVQIFPVTRFDGEKGIVIYFFDNTDRKKVVDELNKKGKMYRRFFEDLQQPATITDLEGEIIRTNQAARDELGYSEEELEEMNLVHDLSVYSEDKERHEDLKKRLNKGDIIVIDDELETKNGEVLPVEVEMSVFELDGELVTGAIQWVVTEREKSKTMLKRIFETINDPILIADKENKIIRVNDEFEEVFKYEESEIEGRDIDSLIVPERKEEEADRLTEKIVGGEHKPVHKKTIRQDKYGNKIEVELVVPSVDINGFGGYAIYRTHEKRKKLENEKMIHKRSTKLLKNISKDFIGINEDEVNEKILSSIRKIGKVMQVDRTYIFEYHNENKMSNTYEWCRNGIKPEKDNLQNLSRDQFPWWDKRLNNNKLIVLDDVEELPEAASVEREILQDQGIQSLIIAPVKYCNEIVGYFGFDMVSEKRSWEDSEKQFMRDIGEIIGEITGKYGRKDF